MSQQAEGRVVAAVFLSSLVAISGLGLVGHAPHSSVSPGTIEPSSFPRRVALQRANAGTPPPAAGSARSLVPVDARPTVPVADGRHHRPDDRAQDAATSGSATVAGRVAVLIASPAVEPPRRTGAAPAPFPAAHAHPIAPTADTVGTAPTVTLVQYGTSAEAAEGLPTPPPAETRPATESRGLLTGGPGLDPDAIECAEGSSSLVPQLDSHGGTRRGPVAEWIRDSIDDLRASRGGVVPFPQRQANAAPSGGRLLDRIRSGERLLSRDRGAKDEASHAGQGPAVSPGGWPVPTPLLVQLDALLKGDAAAWAAETHATLRAIIATTGPADPAANAPLANLTGQWEKGLSLATATADPAIAASIRRAAIATQRRGLVWQGAASAAAVDAAALLDADATAIPEPSIDAPRDSADPHLPTIVALLATLERYESDPSPVEAAAVIASIEGLASSGNPLLADFADTVRNQYAAANVRVAVHQKFVERVMPPAQVTTAPVDDTVLGRQVRGTSRVEQSTAVRFSPDTDGISLVLDVRGDVASRTVTESGPVALTSRGSSSFTVHKPVTVGGAGLRLGRATGSASSRSQLADIQTSFDGVPIMRSLVRNIARNQHDEHLPEANREVIDKIVTRACREVDQQVEPQLLAAAERIRTQAWGPLVKLGLEPTPVSLETSDGIAMARLRLAAQDQLAAHTPRPRAPNGSMLSVQIHESAINNALERLGLAGRRLPLEELVEVLCERAGVEPRSPEELPEDVVVTFAAEQPLRVQYRDGLVHIRVALDSIESGRRGWHDIVASVTYRPKADDPQLFLEREGPVHIGGPGHQGRAEIALRAVFGKLFPKDRPLPLLPETFVTNPKLAEMKVLQAVSTDGWLAISLGELPESVAPVQTKVATPPPARRLLRR
jgi:hypothetical protein